MDSTFGSGACLVKCNSGALQRTKEPQNGLTPPDSAADCADEWVKGYALQKGKLPKREEISGASSGWQIPMDECEKR